MKTKTKALLAFITVFLLGGISGYLINDSFQSMDRETRHSQYENRGEQSFNTDEERTAHRQQMRRRAENRLSERLDLSENQQAEFFSKLQVYQSEIRDSVRSIRSMERSFIQEHYSQFRDDISAVLQEEQLLRLDRFFHPDSIRQNHSQRYSR